MSKFLTQCEKVYQTLINLDELHEDEFSELDIHHSILDRLVEVGVIEKSVDNIVKLSDAVKESNHKIALAAEKFPEGVICLTSALALDFIAKPDPTLIWVAIQKSSLSPRNIDLPINLVDLSKIPNSNNIRTQSIEGIDVKYFDVAKSLVDCFRNRTLVEFDNVKDCFNRIMYHRMITPAEIAEQAKIGGVEKILRPYVETWIVNTSI